MQRLCASTKGVSVYIELPISLADHAHPFSKGYVQALPDNGCLVACEKDEHCMQLAREYWCAAGIRHKVTQLLLPHGAVESSSLLIVWIARATRLSGHHGSSASLSGFTDVL